MTARRHPESGVTLIEMLVALVLFALVGVAGFTILDTILRAGNLSAGRLERLAALDVGIKVVSRDLEQKAPGALTLEEGTLAFPVNGPAGPVAISYSVDAGALLRQIADDSAGEPLEQRLMEDIDGVAWRILDSGQQWSETWPPEDADAPFARAVELTLTLIAQGTSASPRITRLIELPLPVLP